MSTYNTGNPIGSTKVEDLFDNAQNLDIATNSQTQKTWVDRLGVTRKTFHGVEDQGDKIIEKIQQDAASAIAGLGYFVPVEYAPGLEVETTNFTVIGPDGVVYAAQPSALPFVTGAWNPTQWYPIQNTQNPNALLVFSTLAAAESAVTTLPDGQEIEAPDASGRLSRFKAESGALVFQRFITNASALQVVDSSYRLLTGDDSGHYLRFESPFEKNVFISAESNLLGGEEIEITNRAAYGNLYITGDGVTINPIRGKNLTLAPGDTLKLKAISAAVIDVLYGSTSAGSGPLPVIPNENSTFNDEGESTAGWTATGATMSLASSYLRATKTGAVGASCTIKKPWTFTPANRDYIFYGKIRASALSQFDATVISIYNGTKEVAIWFGSNTAGSYAVGSASIIGYEGGAPKNATIAASGLTYNTTAIEFALQYDSKFGQLNCWFRESDGRWKLKARLKTDFVGHTEILIAKHSDAPNASWFEFDYLMLCQPNIIAIGDSHCAGATLFDPDLSLALSDDESTWMRHSKPYPDLRNNLIVNKGVGAQTSAQITARINEVTRENPRTVFMHASSNDLPTTVTKEARSANIQSAVNSIKTANQNVVLLNALYATSAYSGNPGYRDYMKSWWDFDRRKLLSVDKTIDIMQPVVSSDGFLNASLAHSDNVHLTTAGYTLVGPYIAATS